MSWTALLLGTLLLGGTARATRDPEDYRHSLAQRAATDAEALNQQGHHDEAIARCQAWTRAMGKAAPVLYEQAYAQNMKGALDEAMDLYDQVIALDPEHAAARYDRAELHLARGALEPAREDLAVAARLRPDHWAVHLRLAEIAGRSGEPAAFEAHLLDALRHGLDWQTLDQDPTWHDLSRSETVGPVLKRLIAVYGDPGLWDRLVAPPVER